MCERSGSVFEKLRSFFEKMGLDRAFGAGREATDLNKVRRPLAHSEQGAERLALNGLGLGAVGEL